VTTRRLVTILAADVVGYSRLMEREEEATLAWLQDLRTRVVEPKIAEHGGRLVKTTGDGFLVEFGSAVEAVRAAVAIQESTVPPPHADGDDGLLRIGINLGDVIADGGDLYGDGVNVAARLEGIAKPRGICVSRAVRDQIRDRLAVALHDLGEVNVKNLERPVRAFAIDGCIERSATATIGSAEKRRPALPLPDKPSLAVLPFTNMSDDQEQEYFVDGIVDELISSLSRVRSLFVISRNSTFAYKRRVVAPAQVSRELGVQYVLSGAVRRAGGRIRIIVHLIDAVTGGQLWSDRVEGEAEDVFDLQDRITERVVGALQPLIRSVEIERSRRKRPESLDAYDLVMRALPCVWTMDREGNSEALGFLERAIANDPNYAFAIALGAWCHAQRIPHLWTDQPLDERRLALQMAKAAFRLDSDDPVVLTVLARVHNAANEFAAAGPLVEKALRIDPNSSWAWQASGFVKTYLDRADEGIKDFERSIRLSPLDPLNYQARIGIGIAHFWAGRYEPAAHAVSAAISERPSATWAWRIVAAAYANLDRMAEAEAAFQRLVAADPKATLTAVAAGSTPSAASPRYKAALIGGLRKLGMPE
jgi:adenylate cyclase